MTCKRTDENGNRHRCGRGEHERRTAAIRALKGTKSDRHGADGAEGAERGLPEDKSDEQRDPHSHRAAERCRRLKLRPVGSNGRREYLLKRGWGLIHSCQLPVEHERELDTGNCQLMFSVRCAYDREGRPAMRPT